MIIAGTGHREVSNRFDVERRVAESLKASEATHFICGMAAGFDLLAGNVALDMGILVTAARPWAGHTPRVGDEGVYSKIMQSALDIVNVTDEIDYPGPWCYHKRNEWMVDHADKVLAYLDPKTEKGGTFACVKYANKKDKLVRNIYA